MRFRIVLVVCAVIFCAPVFVQAAPVKQTLEVSGWIPYWRAATGTLDVLPHIADITTIHPFGYIVQPDGELYDAAGIETGPWLALREAAAANKVRFIPTVMWSDGEAMHRILSDGPSRRALAERIADLVEEKNFDGVDIDFESKWAETKPYFSLFLEGLYTRMGKKWVYCTIESRTPLSSRYEGTPPPEASMYANDFAKINQYCDRVQIMAYDQGSIDVKLNDSAPGPYVPVADIAWVKKVMELAAQSISKNKLVLGIPTYGYEYAVTPLAEGYRYERLWAFNQKYALDMAGVLGLTPVRNTAGEMNLTYIPTSTPKVAKKVAKVPTSSQVAGPTAAVTQPFNIMWWSDAVSIAQKIGLARQLGIKGVAIFKFDGGEDPRIWGVLSGQ